MNIVNTVSTLTTSGVVPALAAPHPYSFKNILEEGTCLLTYNVLFVVDPHKPSKNPDIKTKTENIAAPAVSKIILISTCQALPFFNVLNKVNRKAAGTTIYLVL